MKGGNGGTPLQGTDSDTTNPGGGGGGSGGRITILTDSNINPENFNVSGGSGGSSSDPDVYQGARWSKWNTKLHKNMGHFRNTS